jgi:hypothetical protein
MFDEICDKNNFGKYLLAVESWENDADHYETNTAWFDTLLDASETYQIFDNASKDLPFVVAGHTFKDLQEASKSGAKDEQGFYISDSLLDLVGGYEYESDRARTTDSVKLYHLNHEGVLSKCSALQQ